MQMIIIHKANERGVVNHGWLKAKHSFSFGSWYNPQKNRFGMLRVLNDDEIDSHFGFDEHPHDNMEIITLVQDGLLKHKDNMGNELLMQANDVQVMSAGKGILHAEVNPSNDITKLFQIWIFPSQKDSVPRYEQKTFLPEQRKNKWQEIIKPHSQKEGEAIFIYQHAWLSLCDLDSKNKIKYTNKRNLNGAYIFVIEGEVEINNTTLFFRDALGITDYSEFEIKANKNSRILVIDVPMQI